MNVNLEKDYLVIDNDLIVVHMYIKRRNISSHWTMTLTPLYGIIYIKAEI